MTFTWKKRNRFSQLVADHLQSPKRRGSLVVETGFPTSLIDLYVRNRGRFRKSSAKKQTVNHSPNQSSSGSFVDSNNSSFDDSVYTRTDEIIEEDVVLVGGEVACDSCSVLDSKNSSDFRRIDEVVVDEAEKSVRMAKFNPVLVVVLKVLFMVVLVFVTKRFTIGITLSAFLLFFLESVRTRLLGRSILIRRSVDSKQTSTVVCSEVLEIEEQLELKQDYRSEKESDEVKTEVFIEIRHKSSRRALMKSSIKKLVPKKLRNRRSSLDSNHEMCCKLKEEETVKSAQNVKPLASSNECSDIKGQQSLSSGLLSENACNDEESGTELQQDFGCFVLFLIVLVGLIEGRVLALVMALSWCLMLKLRSRNVEFSI